MKKIILHWTAGKYSPSYPEKYHYHYLIDGKGEIIKGLFPPEFNFCDISKKPKNYNYTMHTGGGNSYAIGVAFCGMLGYHPFYPASTDYPLTKVQLEAGFEFIAKLAQKYSIPIEKSTVFTHYEFGLKHPNTTSRGKIDINFLPPYSSISSNLVGDFIRNKIAYYFEKINKTDGKQLKLIKAD